MRNVRYSLFVFMLIVLFTTGIIGFRNSEALSTTDAFHSTVAALTFSSDSSSYSSEGKLLNSVLSLASAAVLVWAFVNFHSKSNTEVSSQATDYFKLMPQDEGLMLKEITIGKRSHLAGAKKINVLEKTGTLVMGVKKGKAFELNVPFNRKLAAGTKILVFGTATQLKSVEKEAKR